MSRVRGLPNVHRCDFAFGLSGTRSAISAGGPSNTLIEIGGVAAAMATPDAAACTAEAVRAIADQPLGKGPPALCVVDSRAGQSSFQSAAAASGENAINSRTRKERISIRGSVQRVGFG